jgi:hypothetical protein
MAAVSVLNGGGLEVRCRHEMLLSVIPCNAVIGFAGEDEADMFCDETMEGEGDTEEETGAEVDGDGSFEFES